MAKLGAADPVKKGAMGRAGMVIARVTVAEGTGTTRTDQTAPASRTTAAKRPPSLRPLS